MLTSEQNIIKLNNPKKSIGLINQTETAEMINCYPLNDLNCSRVSGQPKLGAERVIGLFFFKQ
ncbi:hypothetical protein ES707_11023 [subsurface metagenome]